MQDMKGCKAMRPLAAFLFLFVFSCCICAQPPANRLIFNAQPVIRSRPVPTQLGTNRAPNGSTITVNSQYLLRDGKPWIPVMGEFHYTRYPEAYWEEEILKLKASGVDVIATYVIWIHHEEVEGQFDWSGQRDLRRFAELCAKHGMLLYPRIGPWAHGEVRNGGLPDWVLAKSAVRGNDPVYLAEVAKFYAQIGQQLHGLLWKDGGPVIGIQIENEYAAEWSGAGKGRILAALKQLAIWQRPRRALLYRHRLGQCGGSRRSVPARLWRRLSRRSVGRKHGNSSSGRCSFLPLCQPRGRQSGRDQTVTTELSASTTPNLRAEMPFLTAEVGGGIEDTYHRRVGTGSE